MKSTSVLLLNTLAKYKDSICLIGENKELTYGQLDRECNELIGFLPKGKQLILVKARTDIETIVGYLSFLKAGHALIMLDGDVDSQLVENIINIYQPNYIWESLEKAFKYVCSYNTYGLRENNSAKLDIHPNLSLMLSTSGSTGSPKMVKLTKDNIDSNCKSIVKYLNISDAHRAITNLPLHYSYGLSVINTHLCQGASIVITNKSIMSKEFWDIFRKTSATTLSGVPYNYEILRRIGFMNMKLPSLKYLTQAGGKLNQKLVEEYAIWAKGNNIDFFVMYGQTEATARISYVPTNMTLEKGGSVGVAIPGGSLRLKDLSNDDFISEPGKDGELVYQGPNVMMGYATSLGDLSKDDELCGTLHTGDVAKKDYDGYYYITGRLKRFIKIHGNRVGLDEVESYLKSKNFDVLCSGEDNKLMLITKDNSIDVIKNTIINKYGFHYSVIEIKNVSDYPVSSAGKIKYQEIIQIFSKKSSC